MPGRSLVASAGSGRLLGPGAAVRWWGDHRPSASVRCPADHGTSHAAILRRTAVVAFRGAWRCAFRCAWRSRRGRVAGGPVAGTAPARVTRIALTGQRFPLPGGVVDPGGFVGPAVGAGVGPPTTHQRCPQSGSARRSPRAPAGASRCWPRSVTAIHLVRKFEGQRGAPGRVSRLRGAWLRMEINGVDWLTATAPAIPVRRRFRGAAMTFGPPAWSGFRRHATCRQATMACASADVACGFRRGTPADGDDNRRRPVRALSRCPTRRVPPAAPVRDVP